MKRGDLVRVESWHFGSGDFKHTQSLLGIFLRILPYDHPLQTPSFPTCEILSPSGVKLIGAERISLV